MSRKIKPTSRRTGILLGGYVPKGLAFAIDQWIDMAPERDKSTFIRDAAREKLRRDGIKFSEREVGA
jgi:hypothetical protein